jgi:hypothetical protein
MAPSLAAARTQEAPCDASVAPRKFVEELFSVRGMVVWSAGACSRFGARKLASAAAQSSSRSKLRLGESGGKPPHSKKPPELRNGLLLHDASAWWRKLALRRDPGRAGLQPRRKRPASSRRETLLPRHPSPPKGRGAGGEGVASSGGVKTPPFPGGNRNDACFRH